MSRTVRYAVAGDADAIARLLVDFNTEYGDPTPPVADLATRLRELMAADAVIVLADPGPSGVAVLRFRPAIWSSGQECYLAELYVVPALRGQGIGRALMSASIKAARERGADQMDLGTSEDDVAARALYESLGFVNVERLGGPVTYFYQREL